MRKVLPFAVMCGFIFASSAALAVHVGHDACDNDKGDFAGNYFLTATNGSSTWECTFRVPRSGFNQLTRTYLGVEGTCNRVPLPPEAPEALVIGSNFSDFTIASDCQVVSNLITDGFEYFLMVTGRVDIDEGRRHSPKDPHGAILLHGDGPLPGAGSLLRYGVDPEDE